MLIYCLIFLNLMTLTGIGYWPQSGTTGGLTVINPLLSYLVFLLNIICFIHFLPSTPKPKNDLGNRVLPIMFAWACICALLGNYPVSALISTVRLIATTYFFFLMAVHRSETFLEAMRAFTVFFVVINIFFIVFIPSLGIENEIASRSGNWQGALVYKTKLGIISLILLSFHVFNPTRERQKMSLFGLIFALGLLILIIGSQSKTSWFALGFIILSTGFFKVYRHIPARYRPGSVMIWIGIAVVILPIVQSIAIDLLEAAGRDLTFSGRLVIWQYFLQAAQMHPFFGYGIGGASQNVYLIAGAHQMAGWDDFYSAHNSILEWFLIGGYPGLLLFVLLIIGLFHLSYKDFTQGRSLSGMRSLAITITGFSSIMLTSDFAALNGPWLAIYLVLFFNDN